MKVNSRGRNEMAVSVAEKTKLGEWEFRIEGMTPRHLGNDILRSPISETFDYHSGHVLQRVAPLSVILV